MLAGERQFGVVASSDAEGACVSSSTSKLSALHRLCNFSLKLFKKGRNQFHLGSLQPEATCLLLGWGCGPQVQGHQSLCPQQRSAPSAQSQLTTLTLACSAPSLQIPRESMHTHANIHLGQAAGLVVLCGKRCPCGCSRDNVKPDPCGVAEVREAVLREQVSHCP